MYQVIAVGGNDDGKVIAECTDYQDAEELAEELFGLYCNGDDCWSGTAIVEKMGGIDK